MYWGLQLANKFGNGADKLPLEQRHAFAAEHYDDIIDSAENPVEGRRWWIEVRLLVSGLTGLGLTGAGACVMGEKHGKGISWRVVDGCARLVPIHTKRTRKSSFVVCQIFGTLCLSIRSYPY